MLDISLRQHVDKIKVVVCAGLGTVKWSMGSSINLLACLRVEGAINIFLVRAPHRIVDEEKFFVYTIVLMLLRDGEIWAVDTLRVDPNMNRAS